MTRDEAIKAAGDCFAEAEIALREGTVEEAARRAYTPTGPSLDELIDQITAIRAADRSQTPARPGSDSPDTRRGGRVSNRRAS